MELIDIVTFLGWGGMVALSSFLVKSITKLIKQTSILQSAVKASMRKQLLDDYHRFEANGFVSEEDLEEWQNQYKSYHVLVGENGILDARYESLKRMPNNP